MTYTPNTADVKRVYSYAPVNFHECTHLNPTPTYASEQFDRWFAEEIRKAKAEGAREERERGTTVHVTANVLTDTLLDEQPICYVPEWGELVLLVKPSPEETRKSNAKAWDEGYRQGANDEMRYPAIDVVTPNPYEGAM